MENHKLIFEKFREGSQDHVREGQELRIWKYSSVGEQSTVLDKEVEEDDSKVIRNEKVDMTRFIKETEEENVVDWKRRIRNKTETDCELESKITDSNSEL